MLCAFQNCGVPTFRKCHHLDGTPVNSVFRKIGGKNAEKVAAQGLGRDLSNSAGCRLIFGP